MAAMRPLWPPRSTRPGPRSCGSRWPTPPERAAQLVSALDTANGKVECDLVAVAGFRPASEGRGSKLPRHPRPSGRGFRVVVDDQGRTTTPGVWRVGRHGVHRARRRRRGWRPGRCQCRGLDVMRKSPLGRITVIGKATVTAKAQKSRAPVPHTSSRRQPMSSHADLAIVSSWRERLSCAVVRTSRSQPGAQRIAWLSDIEEVKRYTGFGTGPCQGKNAWPRSRPSSPHSPSSPPRRSRRSPLATARTNPAAPARATRGASLRRRPRK